MNKQTANFAVETNNGVVQQIGRSVITQPKVVFDKSKGGIKWFDDSQLIKKNNNKEGGTTMKKKEIKEIKNIGVIDLSELDFAEDCLQIFIPISNMSDKLQKELDEAIQVDKVRSLDDIKGRLASFKNKAWCKQGVDIDTVFLDVTVKNKTITYQIYVDYTDKEDSHLWSGTSIEVDLSAYNTEIKKLVIKAMIDKFF